MAVKAAFASVETYEDLLARNLDYLDGTLAANPYTHVRLSTDADMQAVVPLLQETTHLGYYSITGQVGKAVYNTASEGRGFVSVEQRGYTSGWLPDKHARLLRAWIESDACPQRHDIYYRIDFDNADGYYVQQNMPFSTKGSFNLAREFSSPVSHSARVGAQTAAREHLSKRTQDGERRCPAGSTLECRLEWVERVNCWDDVTHRKNVFYQYREYPRCMQLFLQCAGVYLCTRQYNSEVRVEEVMRAFLLQLPREGEP